MLNRIIKLGNKKVFRSESSATTNDPPPSVTVNHASRANPLTTSQQQQSSTTTSSHSQQPQPPPPPPSTATIEILPSLKDVSSSDRPNLVIRKLHLCCFLCDFTDPLKMVREKEIKRQTLLELLDYIQSSSAKMTEPVHFNLVRTVSVNLFRSLPPCSYENTGSIPTEVADPEEDEPYMEPSWTHLQLVYELLLRYVVSSETDSKIAKRCIDYGFVSRLVDLFETEDVREREYLKTVLHRIYSRFMGHRPFIRSVINNVFYRFAFETERHSGIPEFLEIVGSIVNGFTVPMKEEHKLFLVRALIPLHKPKCLSPYHQQLSYCTTQFVEKDYKLADIVVKGLLKYWPVTNCQKEVLFLGELEEVLELMQIAEFQRCTLPLFRQIARCLNSPHFQVAERALYLWNNENIISLIAQNRRAILPIIFKALERNIQGHWNQAIHGLSGNVQKMFLEMDSQLFEECQRQYLQNEANIQELEEKREMTWKNVEALAAKAG